MTLFIAMLYKKVQILESDNLRLQDNIEYYSSFGQKNIVLQNTIDELKTSNDSLVRKINMIQKDSGIKYKDLNTIVYVETLLTDTLRDTIISDRDFHTIITPNELTSIEVIREDTLLQVIPTIKNSQSLFIYTEKHYKYKSFFSRLIHLNFKKKATNVYTIHNENSLIDVTDTRVIQVIH